MQIQISGEPDFYWIYDGREEHGPFKTILEASSTAVDMVTSFINATPGHQVNFFTTEAK